MLSVERELTLQTLHADLLHTLDEIEDNEHAHMLREVVLGMEELVAKDAEARTTRLHELDAKQRQLIDLHSAVQQHDAEEVQAITEMCRESIGHLIAECRHYHHELATLREENSNLRKVKTEIVSLKREGQEVANALTESRDRMAELEHENAIYREKAETLAVHLVQTVKERQELEEKNTTLTEKSEDLQQSLTVCEERLSSFEEAAQADIEELTTRDKQLSQHLLEKKKEGGVMAEQVQGLQLRSDKLASELSTKCNEVNHYRQQLAEAGEALQTLKNSSAVAKAGEFEKLQNNMHHVTKELTIKCEQVSALTIKLNTAKEALAEKDKLLDKVRSEAVRIRDLSDEQKTAHTRSEETLQHELRSQGQRYSNAVNEAARLRAAEDSHRHQLEDLRAREIDRSARNAAEAERLREVERVLDKERRAKEELAQSVLELQRQTIELAQDKGRLNAEVARSRSHSHQSLQSHESLPPPGTTILSSQFIEQGRVEQQGNVVRSYSPTLTQITQRTVSVAEQEMDRVAAAVFPQMQGGAVHSQVGAAAATSHSGRSLSELEGELMKVRDELHSLGNKRAKTSPAPPQ